MKLPVKIVEFVGLSTKLYFYKMCDGNENKQFKGVAKNVIKGILNLMTIAHAF